MKKKIAYIINHAAFFYSHISQVALKARKKNYDIKLFCGLQASKEMEEYAIKELRKKKISVVRNNFKSSGTNFFLEFYGFIQLLKSVRKFNPDIIHCATPKGIILGGLISYILNIKSLVVFNSGMGFMFSNKINFYHKILKNLYIFLLNNIVMKHPNKKIIVENKDDYIFLKKKYNLKIKELEFIKGAGVDLNKFNIQNQNSNKQVLLPARVIKEKGIKEFLLAAKNLKNKFPNWKFVVAGTIDYEKQSNFKINEINYLNKNNQAIFLGYIKNMLKIYKKTSIVCLPSYREGFSKTLQEAAALGIPIVTTNVTGCKDAIIPNVTGLLCMKQNYKSLQNKLEILILNKKKRISFGKKGRKLAEKEFSLSNVLNRNINIYSYLTSNEKKFNSNRA